MIKVKKMYVNYFLQGIEQGIVEAILECRPRASAHRPGQADQAYKQGRVYGLEHAQELLPAYKENKIMQELLHMKVVELI